MGENRRWVGRYTRVLLAGATLVALILALGQGGERARAALPVPITFIVQGGTVTANALGFQDPLTCTVSSGQLTVQPGPVLTGEFETDYQLADITSLQMTATCNPGGYTEKITLNLQQQSDGYTEEQQDQNPGVLDYPADSFFDVFFNIDPTQLPNVHNRATEPLAVNCTITNIQNNFGCTLGPVPLYNQDESSQLGSIKSGSLTFRQETPPPPSLGGTADYPDVSSGPNVALLAGVVAIAMAGVLALGGAAWYARRRSSS